MPVQKYSPTILISFGVTGDLTRRKVVPALYRLHKLGMLPDLFKIVGFGRRDWSDDDFKIYIQESFPLGKEDPSQYDRFIDYFCFQQGDFEENHSFVDLNQKLKSIDLEWGICTNKLFHLAVPPEHYEKLLKKLEHSGLTISCHEQKNHADHSSINIGGWTRIIVEKPFGKDLTTAEKLDVLLGKLFKEEQIYRIDHYLAKEMLQNIIAFRFSNNLLEDSWDNRGIERIDIRLNETLGVEGRGAFYDGVGALRDVGQNHMLQMLALITMEQPNEYTATEIRARRTQVLNELKTIEHKTATTKTTRGQYLGYLDETNVNSKSSTETYFKINAEINNEDWRGVPITLESGKRMDKVQKEIDILFKHPSKCLCPDNQHYQNRIKFILEPTESIQVEFWSKKPGLGYELEKQTLKFTVDEEFKNGHHASAYAKILHDCITGDQTLFVSTSEVKAMWRFIDPIVDAWSRGETPLKIYGS